MTQTTLGTVHNGEIVEIDLGFYKGLAGARVRDEVFELAFVAAMPRPVPVTGTLGGEQVSILSLRRSALARTMLVATVR